MFPIPMSDMIVLYVLVSVGSNVHVGWDFSAILHARSWVKTQLVPTDEDSGETFLGSCL